MQASVPRVEIADDRDRARVRRPDGERSAGDAVDFADVCPELLVQLFVAPLHGEVLVELAERRQECVRVAERERVPVRVLDLELVSERQLRAGQQRLPEAGRILELGLDAGRLDAHGLGLGPVRADDDAAVRLVGPEHRVRIRAELDHQAGVPSSIIR